ncbi:hypothetical protein ACIPY5_14985 [Microbacterium sp. NPDC089698]|uniref:hypothetical protein n=1 Tax=Microbacterium sp. NPDC089698 TaxID=3364200 RepID=UPI003814C5C2
MTQRNTTNDSDSKPNHDESGRRRRWSTFKVALGVVGSIAAIVVAVPTFGSWSAAEHANTLSEQAVEDGKPRISFAVSQRHDLFLLDGIYVTNTGGSDITVSSVEVQSLAYPFIDTTVSPPCQKDSAGNVVSCSGEYVAIGVFDYASAWRANNEGALYMGSVESCSANATEVPANGRPVAFGAVVGPPRDARGNLLIGMAALPASFKFTVTVTFAGNKLKPETVTFDPRTDMPDPAQDAGMSDDFTAIGEKCTHDLLSNDPKHSPKVPSGTKYASYLYLPHTRAASARLVAGPVKQFD